MDTSERLRAHLLSPLLPTFFSLLRYCLSHTFPLRLIKKKPRLIQPRAIIDRKYLPRIVYYLWCDRVQAADCPCPVHSIVMRKFESKPFSELLSIPLEAQTLTVRLVVSGRRSCMPISGYTKDSHTQLTLTTLQTK